jgi:hypothetical protein
MTVSINGTSGLVFNDASTQATAATGFGFKNRLINGDMRIDQRNNGASVTLTGGNTYPVDRFVGQNNNSNSAVVTSQQSTTVPTGFKNSVVATVTTGGAVAASDRTFLAQFIEGYNIADLGFGTASASTVTLSFWVRSSVTGTFGGSLSNSAVNRAYPFTYTISAANTWEQKSVTVAGDTSGTWLTDNGVGLRVYFALGVGTDRQGTAGVWGSADYRSATGATNIVTTTGATFYITGVQLEKGSTATSFDYRPYGTELMLCERYYQVIQNTGAGTGLAPQDGGFIQLAAFDTTSAYGGIVFQQTMRASPTISLSDTPANTINLLWNGVSSDCDSFAVNNTSVQRAEVAFSATSNYTSGNAVWARIKQNKSVNISAEL